MTSRSNDARSRGSRSTTMHRHTTWSSAVAFCIGLGMSAAACGGTTTSGAGGAGGGGSTTVTGATTGAGGADAGLTAVEACTALQKAVCARRDACTNMLGNKVTYGSESACEAATIPVCVANLGAPKTAGTPAHSDACAMAYGGLSCTDFFDGNPLPACIPPAGPGATGTACAVGAQCASSYCAVGAEENCGTCQPLPKAGAACATRADCGYNLDCAKLLPTAAEGACTAYVAVNGACDRVNVCEAGLACVGASFKKGVMGKCALQAAAVGADCDSKRQTLPDCDHDLGLFCPVTAGVGTSAKCAEITFVAAGQACGQTTPTTFDACQDGATCVRSAPMATTGTCVAPVANGVACDSVAGPPCTPPAKCVPTADGGTAGTCTAPDPSACK